jgi:hypothetical protein
LSGSTGSAGFFEKSVYVGPTGDSIIGPKPFPNITIKNAQIGPLNLLSSWLADIAGEHVSQQHDCVSCSFFLSFDIAVIMLLVTLDSLLMISFSPIVSNRSLIPSPVFADVMKK